jgi:nucleotide-binding universal stress UspA family protein
VFSILAPVFFGIVGLKVDLWTLHGGSMLGVVLAIACLGKLVGCTLGGVWGGMRIWEAVSIAVAMNARGAMGLVAATIGLSLGILNQQTFSIIVVVAIVTSFLAPLLLRVTMRMVRMSEEEAKRILIEQSRGVFDPTRLRFLVPTAGGPHALTAARIATQMTKKSDHPPQVMFVEARTSWRQWLANLFRKKEAGKHIDEHLQQIRALGNGVAPEIRKVVGASASGCILEEAQKGFDVILIGASGRGRLVGGRVLEDVVSDAPCHVVIAREGTPRPEHFTSIFVPFDGTMAARVAAEFALRYAEAVSARLTLAVLRERRPQAESYAELQPDTVLDRPSLLLGQAYESDSVARRMPTPPPPPEDPVPENPEEELARVSPAFRASDIRATLRYLAYDPSHSALTEEIGRGGYDLVVTGAENRAVQHRMFFGYESQRVIERCAVTTLIVVPKIARLK